MTRSNSARQVIERMLEQFRRHFTPELRDRPGARAHAAPGRRPRVDRSEGDRAAARGADRGRRVPEPARRRHAIAGGSTVTFALKQDGRWTGLLHRADYTYTPYNTYLYDGLPGPSAIRARGADGRRPPARTVFLLRRRRERRTHLLAHLRATPPGDRHEPATARKPVPRLPETPRLRPTEGPADRP